MYFLNALFDTDFLEYGFEHKFLWESCRVHQSLCVLCTWSAVSVSFPLLLSSWALTAFTDILKLSDEIQGKEWNMVGAFWWFFSPHNYLFQPRGSFLKIREPDHWSCVYSWGFELDLSCTSPLYTWIIIIFIFIFIFSVNMIYVIQTVKLICRCQAMGRVSIADPLLVQGSISCMLGIEFGYLLWCPSHFGIFFPLFILCCIVL